MEQFEKQDSQTWEVQADLSFVTVPPRRGSQDNQHPGMGQNSTSPWKYCTFIIHIGVHIDTHMCMHIH